MVSEMFGRIMLFFLFFLALLPIGLSQPLDIEGILSSLTGVIFILVFILILLWLGGVIKPGVGGKIPWFMVIFAATIILLFVVPQYVGYPAYIEVPENFKMYPLPKYASQFLEMLGLPSDWMYIPAIIYLFILPFAGIYTLVWAFLSIIKIFEGLPKNVNVVLSFIITFLTIPVGWFVKIVWVVFSFLGIWSVVIFGATFILTVLFKGYGVVEKERYEAMGRRWRAEARRHLENALTEIKNRYAAGAINELNAAKNFAGFHSDYYTQLNAAVNNLNQATPNYEEAKRAIEQALKYL